MKPWMQEWVEAENQSGEEIPLAEREWYCRECGRNEYSCECGLEWWEL